MASPFSVFRKHQKGLMAGLVIVAMISFIVLGTADQFMQFGSGGNPEAARPVAKWSGGEFTVGEVEQIRYNRAALNQFIVGVRRIAAQNHGSERFDGSPTYNTESERDIVLSELLVQKAKKLGIVVTDEQVTEEITRISGDSVSTSQLNTILREMRGREQNITYPQLVEAFRRELLVRQVKILFAGPDRETDTLATPAQRWDYFCRLNRRVKLEAYAFPVEQYITDLRIPEPTDAQLRSFYDEHKDNVASPMSPEPGFRDPAGVKLEYLKADYLKFYNDAKSKLTDDEIRKEFDKRKDDMRRNIEFDEEMDGIDDPLGALDDEEKEDEKKDDGNPVVKATEPDPSAYEEAVGKFAKRAPKATEPRFTDDEILARSRDAIVKRLAEAKARDAMQKVLNEAYQKMDRFYASQYRRWDLANAAKEGEASSDSPTTPPPTFDLAKLADPEAGLTYHQTTMLSQEEMIVDKYFSQTFANRRWGVEKNPLTDVEQPRIVEQGVVLPLYVFQTRTLMSPFKAEDAIAGSAEEFYRNQYVFWKTAERKQNTPAFEDIKDRVKRAWKIANTSGKSAREFAKESAKRLADQINGDKTTLKERFPGEGEVKETDEFTWYEQQTLPSGIGALPSVNTEPRRTRLDEVESAGERFFRDVFRLGDKQAGVVMNDAGSIVYVVQVFDAADASRDALRQAFMRTPYTKYLPGLSQYLGVPDEQGYAIASAFDMERRRFDWYKQLERDYAVKWESRETE